VPAFVIDLAVEEGTDADFDTNFCRVQAGDVEALPRAFIERALRRQSEVGWADTDEGDGW
jgi:hypothetical protein